VWTRREGSELAIADSLIVCASRSLNAELAKRLTDEGFDLRALAPYDEKFLVDWSAEIYQIALADASLVAHERVFARAQERIQQGEASSARDMSLDPTSIVINGYNLLLLPVWLGEVRVGAQAYPFAINGQTGSVHGDVPHGLLGKLVGWLSG